MDAIAREVGREPGKSARRTWCRANRCPTSTSPASTWTAAIIPASLRRALDMIGVDAIRERQRRRADGASSAWAWPPTRSRPRTAPRCSPPGARPSFRASTGHGRVTPDGGLELRVGVHSHGQGMETTFAQIASEILGVDVASIKLLHGDTGQTPFSTGTYASRSLVMSGGAVSQACKRLLPRLTHIGAHLLQADAASVAWNGDRLEAGGKSVSVRTWPTPGTCGRSCCRPTWIPPDWKSPSATSRRSTPAVSPTPPTRRWWRWTGTGGVEILDYVVVEDGTMINPMVVEGQTIGGVARASAPPSTRKRPTTTTASRWRRRWPTTCCPAQPGAEHAPASLRDAIAAYRVRRQGMGEAAPSRRRRCCSTRSTMRCARWARPSCCARRCRRRGCSPPSRRAAASPARQRGGDGMKAAAFEYASGLAAGGLAGAAHEAAPSSWPAGNRWDPC